jgi:hypothetical protein
VARRFGAAARFGRERFFAAAARFLGRAPRRFAFDFFVAFAFFAVERRGAFFFRAFAIVCLLPGALPGVGGTNLGRARASTAVGARDDDIDRRAPRRMMPQW